MVNYILYKRIQESSMQKSLPTLYNYTNTDLVIIGTSQVLKEYQKKLSNANESTNKIAKFSIKNPFCSSSDTRPYTIDEYLWLLQEHSEIEEEVLVYSLALILRFLGEMKLLGKINFLKLIAVTQFISQKMHLDSGLWTSTDFGSFSGLSQERLLELEIEFAKLLKFNLFVSKKEFNRVFKMIKSEVKDL